MTATRYVLTVGDSGVGDHGAGLACWSSAQPSPTPVHVVAVESVLDETALSPADEICATLGVSCGNLTAGFTPLTPTALGAATGFGDLFGPLSFLIGDGADGAPGQAGGSGGLLFGNGGASGADGA